MATIRDSFRGLFTRDFAATFILKQGKKFEWEDFNQHRKLFVTYTLENLLKQLLVQSKGTATPLLNHPLTTPIASLRHETVVRERHVGTLTMIEKEALKQIVVAQLTEYTPFEEIRGGEPFFPSTLIKRLAKVALPYIESPNARRSQSASDTQKTQAVTERAGKSGAQSSTPAPSRFDASSSVSSPQKHSRVRQPPLQSSTLLPLEASMDSTEREAVVPANEIEASNWDESAILSSTPRLLDNERSLGGVHVTSSPPSVSVTPAGRSPKAVSIIPAPDVPGNLSESDRGQERIQERSHSLSEASISESVRARISSVHSKKSKQEEQLEVLSDLVEMKKHELSKMAQAINVEELRRGSYDKLTAIAQSELANAEKLSQKKQEIDARLSQDILEKQRQLHDLELRIEGKKTDWKALQAKLDESHKAKLSWSEDALTKINLEIEHQQKEAAQWSQKITMLQHDHNNALEALQQVEALRGRKEEEIETKSQHLAGLARQHDAVAMAIRTLSDTIEAKNDGVKALERELQVVKGELVAKQQILSETEAKAEESLQNLRNHHLAVTRAHEESRREMDADQERIAELKKTESVQQLKLSQLQEHIDRQELQHQETLRKQTEELDILRDNVRQTKAEGEYAKQSAAAELERIRTTIQDVTAQLIRKEYELTNITGKVSAEVAAAEREVQSRMKVSLQKLVELQQGISSHQDQAQSAHAMVEQLKQQVRDLQAQISQIEAGKQEQIDQLDANNARLRAEQQALIQSRDQIYRETEAAKIEFVAVHEKTGITRREWEKVEARLRDQQSMWDNLLDTKGQQLAAAEAQVNSMKETILGLQQKVSPLQNQLAALETLRIQKQEALDTLDRVTKLHREEEEQVRASLQAQKRTIESTLQRSVEESMSGSVASLRQVMGDLESRYEKEKQMFDDLHKKRIDVELYVKRMQSDAQAQMDAEKIEREHVMHSLDQELGLKREQLRNIEGKLNSIVVETTDLERRRMDLIGRISDLGALAQDTPNLLAQRSPKYSSPPQPHVRSPPSKHQMGPLSISTGSAPLYVSPSSPMAPLMPSQTRSPRMMPSSHPQSAPHHFHSSGQPVYRPPDSHRSSNDSHIPVDDSATIHDPSHPDELDPELLQGDLALDREYLELLDRRMLGMPSMSQRSQQMRIGSR